MNKDIKIARLEAKLNNAQEEMKKLKAEVRAAKAENRKSSKKKDVKSITLSKEQQQLLSKLLSGTPTPDSL